MCIRDRFFSRYETRDLLQNELLVRRHLVAGDAYVHTDVRGCPSVSDHLLNAQNTALFPGDREEHLTTPFGRGYPSPHIARGGHDGRLLQRRLGRQGADGRLVGQARSGTCTID